MSAPGPLSWDQRSIPNRPFTPQSRSLAGHGAEPESGPLFIFMVPSGLVRAGYAGSA